MKIKELITLLKKEDQEREVIMTIDPESDIHYPLTYIWAGAFIPELKGPGGTYLEKLTEEDIKNGCTEEDLGPLDAEGRVKAIILSYIN